MPSTNQRRASAQLSVSPKTSSRPVGRAPPAGRAGACRRRAARGRGRGRARTAASSCMVAMSHSGGPIDTSSRSIHSSSPPERRRLPACASPCSTVVGPGGAGVLGGPAQEREVVRRRAPSWSEQAGQVESRRARGPTPARRSRPARRGGRGAWQRTRRPWRGGRGRGRGRAGEVQNVIAKPSRSCGPGGQFVAGRHDRRAAATRWRVAAISSPSRSTRDRTSRVAHVGPRATTGAGRRWTRGNRSCSTTGSSTRRPCDRLRPPRPPPPPPRPRRSSAAATCANLPLRREVGPGANAPASRRALDGSAAGQPGSGVSMRCGSRSARLTGSSRR